MEISTITRVARTLFFTACIGFVSSIGTCLYAAAWKTTSGGYRSKTCAHLRRVAAVGEHRDHRGEVPLVDELALHLVERRLRLVDEDEPLRAELDDLAAQLRADRAAARP